MIFGVIQSNEKKQDPPLSGRHEIVIDHGQNTKKKRDFRFFIVKLTRIPSIYGIASPKPVNYAVSL